MPLPFSPFSHSQKSYSEPVVDLNAAQRRRLGSEEMPGSFTTQNSIRHTSNRQKSHKRITEIIDIPAPDELDTRLQKLQGLTQRRSLEILPPRPMENSLEYYNGHVLALHHIDGGLPPQPTNSLADEDIVPTCGTCLEVVAETVCHPLAAISNTIEDTCFSVCHPVLACESTTIGQSLLTFYDRLPSAWELYRHARNVGLTFAVIAGILLYPSQFMSPTFRLYNRKVWNVLTKLAFFLPAIEVVRALDDMKNEPSEEVTVSDLIDKLEGLEGRREMLRKVINDEDNEHRKRLVGRLASFLYMPD